jgi:hypothetical protein
MLRRLLVEERGETLDLLAGLPAEWIRPGARLALTGIPTAQGSLTCSLECAADGRSILLRVEPLGGRGLGTGPTVHLQTLKDLGFRLAQAPTTPDRLEGRWGEELLVRFVR